MGLPFDKFLDFYVDGNYRALLIHGDCDILNLVDAGEKVKSEFFDYTTGMGSSTGVKEAIKIQQLESRLQRVAAIVDSLSMRYNKELADMLRGLGIITKVKEETLHEDLEKVMRETGRFNMEIDQIADYLKSKQVKTEKPKREHFENILTEIDPKLLAEHIDTYRFTVLYQKLKRQQEREPDGRRADK